MYHIYEFSYTIKCTVGKVSTSSPADPPSLPPHKNGNGLQLSGQMRVRDRNKKNVIFQNFFIFYLSPSRWTYPENYRPLPPLQGGKLRKSAGDETLTFPTVYTSFHHKNRDTVLNRFFTGNFSSQVKLIIKVGFH